MPAVPRVPTLTRTDALRSGISRWRLEGPEFTRVRRGLYVPSDVPVSGVDQRIALAAEALPDGYAIGGWAAARAHERQRLGGDGIAVFDGRLPEMDVSARVGLPVLVCGSRPQRLRPVPGVRLFRSDLAADEVVVLDGVPVTSALRTAFDLARLWSTTPAVVALDQLRHLGLLEPDALSSLLVERTKWRGTPRARYALALSQDHVESPRESMMRLLWHAAGLPRPACNASVFDGRGRFVARVDLLDDAAGLVAEYDGAYHATAGRRRSDAVRQEALEDLGLLVTRANDPDIVTSGGRAVWQARLRRAHERARTLERPRRWTSARST